MRQLSEIESDIREIDRRISELNTQRTALKAERDERRCADFCEKYGVRSGDIVRTTDYGDLMVCGIDSRYGSWISVRKIKKNGEPYSIANSQSEGCFEGCQVIGHIEEDAAQ